MNIETLEQLYSNEEYQIFESETLLNPQYHMINSTDVDIDLMIEYNANGMFGVTHADFIASWREYLDLLDYDQEITEQQYKDISKEIDDCENWHTKNNSLYDLI